MSISISDTKCAQAPQLARCLLHIETPGEGFTEITAECARWLAGIGAGEGILFVFCRHSSASLTVQENADPDVVTDLRAALDRLAPQDGPYIHTIEGPDDMPGHIRTMLTGIDLAIPVSGGAMMLGTWQGIMLIEHRARPHRRELVLTFMGDLGPGARARIA